MPRMVNAFRAGAATAAAAAIAAAGTMNTASSSLLAAVAAVAAGAAGRAASHYNHVVVGVHHGSGLMTLESCMDPGHAIMDPQALDHLGVHDGSKQATNANRAHGRQNDAQGPKQRIKARIGLFSDGIYRILPSPHLK